MTFVSTRWAISSAEPHHHQHRRRRAVRRNTGLKVDHKLISFSVSHPTTAAEQRAGEAEGEDEKPRTSTDLCSSPEPADLRGHRGEEGGDREERREGKKQGKKGRLERKERTRPGDESGRVEEGMKAGVKGS